MLYASNFTFRSTGNIDTHPALAANDTGIPSGGVLRVLVYWRTRPLTPNQKPPARRQLTLEEREMEGRRRQRRSRERWREGGGGAERDGGRGGEGAERDGGEAAAEEEQREMEGRQCGREETLLQRLKTPV